MPDFNPYAPPETTEAPPPPARAPDAKLFDARAIAVCSVLFTPVVGAVLAAFNHQRLGNAAAMRRTLVTTGLPSVALVVLTIGAGERLSGVMRIMNLGVGLALGTHFYAEHRPLAQQHVDAGGGMMKWQFTLVSVVVIVLALFAALAALSTLAGHA